MSELSVRQHDGEWEVWVDASEGEFDGAVIGVGDTKRAALEDAMDCCDQFTTELLNLRERAKAKR